MLCPNRPTTLRAHTISDLAKALLDKNPTALRQAKHACKRIIDMDWDASADYLFTKIDQTRFLDPEEGRQRAMRQFLDEKMYRPGLGNYNAKAESSAITGNKRAATRNATAI